jgi:hypothetical protein
MHTQVAYYGRMARTAKPYRLTSRITEGCRKLIDVMMAKYGISEAAVVEQAVREYAEKRNITISEPTTVTEYEHKPTPSHVVSER